MKKWLKFFCLSFFSNEISKDGAKRGYTNFFIGFLLALIFIWAGFFGGDTLPFGSHYNNSPDFRATAHSLFANQAQEKRVLVEIEDNLLKAKKQGGEFTQTLLVNTFESAEDKLNYSVNGYNAVVDLRPADTLAEVEAYCISNDGKNFEITYQEYLTLSEVTKLNFNFKLRYTGNALDLTDDLVNSYKQFVQGVSDESRQAIQTLENDLAENKITQAEYGRAVYELYFTNYYPKITEYESVSKVPLLRNYYYHNYINKGENKYLFVFNDYMSGSFETSSGIKVSFYGFYANAKKGVLIADGLSGEQATGLVDGFIKDSFKSITSLNIYAHAMNTLSFAPFIALMPMVVTLLAYSLLRIRGVESVNSLGSAFKIIGSYVWFSGFISAVLTVIISFFVQRNIINALPLVLFFIILAIRSIIFAVKEIRINAKRLEQEECEETEV